MSFVLVSALSMKKSFKTSGPGHFQHSNFILGQVTLSHILTEYNLESPLSQTADQLSDLLVKFNGKI